MPPDLWDGKESESQMSVFTTQSVGCRLFVDAILGKNEAKPDFCDGWEVQRIVDAAKASNTDGRSVSIDHAE